MAIAEQHSAGSPSAVGHSLNRIIDFSSDLPAASYEENWLEAAWRIVLLRDHNTRVVVLGVGLLGLACGMVGSFMLLRKRALVGDAVSHASLPGIVVAFLSADRLGHDSKSLNLLLFGAAISGLWGMGLILLIRRTTKLREDAAMGIVLSVFFGCGVVLLGMAQQLPTGHAAGLETFIFGKTASMTVVDVRVIGGTALICGLASCLLMKEFKLLCFDEGFAGSRCYPVVGLDALLMTVVIAVIIVGLQAIGLILIVALLVIPPASANFWTHRLRTMFLLSALMGAGCGIVGALLSALLAKLPSGGLIVLVGSAVFLFSALLGTQRGIVWRLLEQSLLHRNIDRQHLLRSLFELAEAAELGGPVSPAAQTPVDLEQLLTNRSWSRRRLSKAIRLAQRDELVIRSRNQVLLTEKGRIEAVRLTRQHRLWELYLIHFADTATSRVDRAADRIEHVLEPHTVRQLELLLDHGSEEVPHDPHANVEELGQIAVRSTFE